MKIKEILAITNHRQWDIPTTSWTFYQEWNNVVFLHWKVDLHKLNKFVPKELEIDLFDGKAWISMVAFTMENLRPRNLPSLSLFSNFHQINIRTYVKYKGKRGVYFLSIEGANIISSKLAKKISSLPYHYSKISRKINSFYSSNSNLMNHLDLKYKIKQDLKEKEPIDIWLTERYALFQDTKKHIYSYEIHHLEWTLNDLIVDVQNLSYPKLTNLINNTPDRTSYSKGIKVITWNKVKYLRIRFKNNQYK